MTKALLTAAGAFVLAAVMFSVSAKAECWATAYGWSCAPSATYSYYPQLYVAAAYPAWYPATAYPAWNAWDYQDYRLRPLWLPSYPGPRPSSNAAIDGF
jgi:hypothetical protein